MPTDPAARLARFQQDFPGLWESLNATQQQRITNAASQQGTYEAFKASVSAYPVVSAWITANPPVDTTTADTTTTDQFPIDATFTTGPPQTLVYDPTADIRTTIQGYMQQWGLGDLNSFLQQAISEKWSADQIIIQLRQTPQYLAVFPENGLRKDNGFTFMPESQILAYRNEAKRLAGQYLGIHVSNDEVANLIAHDNSIAELEQKLSTEAQVQRYGPQAQEYFLSELGYALTPQRLHDFFSNDVQTPELDRAYQTARMRAQAEGLPGVGVRPPTESQQLYKLGLNADQVFAGYQGIASELPAAQRFAAIENFINQSPNTPNDMSVPFGTLFNIAFLQDPEAIKKLQGWVSNESARFTATGGAARSGTQLAGLLPGGQQPV